jgi:hypothetical protein
MRSETDKAKLEEFMAALGRRVSGPGRIYLTGGATAVLHGWRSMTLDIDLKPGPEPPGFLEALALLKDELDLIRYPAVDSASFRTAVIEFCQEPPP